MIVECESCKTRFRLDDARIPARGVKVRCSRCKTTFVVRRPSATHEEAIQEVVAEATSPGHSSAPEPAADLFGSSSSVIGEALPPQAATPPVEGGEQWEFDDGPRAKAAAPGAPPELAAPRSRTTAAPRARTPARDEEALPSLGEPSGWDLLGESSERLAKGVSFQVPEQAPEPPSQKRGAREDASTESVDAAVRAAAKSAPAAARSGVRESLRSALALVVVGSGWMAAGGLCALGFALALVPRSLPAVPHTPRVVSAALDGASSEVVVRTLESAVAGKIVVVHGQLSPSGVASTPLRLRATWLDAGGSPLPGASIIAGPPLPERKLREHAIERLHADHAAHALELTAGGPFEAVFAALPAEAVRLALAREPAPVPIAESPALEAPAESAPAGDATASSPPSAPPSSE